MTISYSSDTTTKRRTIDIGTEEGLESADKKSGNKRFMPDSINTICQKAMAKAFSETLTIMMTEIDLVKKDRRLPVRNPYYK